MTPESYPVQGAPARAPLFLTVDQVAEALQVSVRTVWRLLASGRLRALRDGRVVRVPAGELDRLAAGAVARGRPPRPRAASSPSKGRR